MCGAVAVGVVWYCSGLGYVMSVMLEPQNSMVASVAIVLVLGGFFNGVEPRFRTLTPTMKTVFGAPPRSCFAISRCYHDELSPLGDALPLHPPPTMKTVFWCAPGICSSCPG